jgi:Domain of unknown function (DUF1833)
MAQSTLEAALQEAYATARTDVLLLDTIVIQQSNGNTLYLVQDRVNHTFATSDGVLHEFEAAAFRFVLPNTGNDGVQELSISIDNVDRRVGLFAEEAAANDASIRVIYSPYIASIPDTPQRNPPLTLFLTDIVITAMELTARASFADVVNKRFLTEFYNRERFPAL